MWDFRSGVDVGSFGDEVDKAIAAFFARTDLGFFREDLISESRMQCEAHRTFFEGKEALVVIGLGGSSLGTRAMSQALFPGKLDRLHFLDNVDAFTLDAWIDSVESPEKLGWFVCSKSGGTIEVTSLFDYCHQEFKKKHNISILENTAVATESKDSLLKNLADQHQLPCLEIPLDVGGRFSAFTPVGLFPLSFLGLNFRL